MSIICFYIVSMIYNNNISKTKLVHNNSLKGLVFLFSLLAKLLLIYATSPLFLIVPCFSFSVLKAGLTYSAYHRKFFCNP